ncbi:MAG: hypothetical protein O2967_00830 [Proteobacteria bacterium]|nr:hypothetical protein [Pseudomonadota bacterium]
MPFGARASAGGSQTQMVGMARKPNYNFERQERDRRKAEKKAAKAAAKADKADKTKEEKDDSSPWDDTAEPE